MMKKSIFILIFVAIALIFLLGYRFPGVLLHQEYILRLLYLLLLLAVLASSWRMRNLKGRQTLQYGALWLAIIVFLMLAYDILKRVT